MAQPDAITRMNLGPGQIGIRYKGQGEYRAASCIHVWRPTDPEIRRGAAMSASSGPKDYLRNDIIALFNASKADSIMMLTLNKTPFLIVRKGERLFDLSAPDPREVEIYIEGYERVADCAQVPGVQRA